MKEKKQEKVEQHQELKRDKGRLWQCREIDVIPIIINWQGF